MKKAIVGLAMAVQTLALGQQKAYYQQQAKYQMDIDVDAQNFTYQGKQNLKYTNNSPDELQVIYFHLYWNAFKPNSMMDQRLHFFGKNADWRMVTKNGDEVVSRIATLPTNEQGAQNIHFIKQNGQNLKFEIQESIMKVYLNKPIKANSSTEISLEWDAQIPQQIRRAGRNNTEEVAMTMTQWYPKIAEYDYEGWHAFDYIGREFHAPFADFDVKIKIDKNYVIGAGGVLQNPTEVKGYNPNAKPKADEKGKTTWQWKANNILDFAWAADTDYSVEKIDVTDGPEVFFVYQKNEKTAKNWEESKPKVAKFFQIMNSTFGQYQWPTYSFIQGGDGGMEYGMCSMLSANSRSFEGLAGLMFHEGAHSWYQHMMATNESTQAWMDEGFTSYAEDYISHALFPNKNPHPFVESLKNYRDFAKTGKEEASAQLSDHFENNKAYTYATYIKGKLYLVQLGYIMGEENLQKTLRAYHENWAMKHPNDKDFLHLAQKVSGMDLKLFHNYWINTTKTIDYAIKDVKFTETETQVTLINKSLVPMPIDFSVMKSNGEVVNYNIPLNTLRKTKEKDVFGTLTPLKAWPWTQKEYTFSLPYKKEELKLLGIDFSQRLADINPEDNMFEVK